ncbi:hypothetical protein N7478_008418 [Penicillium angulare]|uniref:uncharacterized protein n=1 Tax=Penicillium angulare TaxID=116970 RepID=UPI0025407D0B|nr:uncharacterized protein N7478_008418 [Penicillium angulare]KAJ5273293.1 hypothetical protein N7478_008418 [Penicillium angulare]
MENPFESGGLKSTLGVCIRLILWGFLGLVVSIVMLVGGIFLSPVTVASACASAYAFSRDSIRHGWINGSRVIRTLFENITNTTLDFPSQLFKGWPNTFSLTSRLSQHMANSRRKFFQFGGDSSRYSGSFSGDLTISSADTFGYNLEPAYEDRVLYDRDDWITSMLPDQQVPNTPRNTWTVQSRDARDASGGHVHMSTKDGIVVIDYVYRPEDGSFPHVRPIVNELYQTAHGTTPLKHILVTNVDGTDYLRFDISPVSDFA